MVTQVQAPEAAFTFQTPEEILLKREADKKSRIDAAIQEAAAKEQRPWRRAAAKTGAALGAGFGEAIAEQLRPKTDSEKRAIELDAAQKEFDANWQDAEDVAPAVNRANKLEAQYKALMPYLDAKQRHELSAMNYAAATDAFNQQRLVAGDELAQAQFATQQRDAGLQYRIDKLNLEAQQRLATEGDAASQWVFKTPAGKRVYAAEGGEAFRSLMKKVNDPNGGGGVTLLGTQAQVATQDLEDQKSANKDKLPVKYTAGQLTSFDEFAKAAQNMAVLYSPEGQQGLRRFGIYGLKDSLQEKVAPFSFELLSGETLSTTAETALANLKIAMQSLIPGIPSNYDSQLIEAAQPQRTTTDYNQAMNRIRYVRKDLELRLRARLADHYKNAGASDPPPAALLQAAVNLGIDTTDIQGADAEYDRYSSDPQRLKELEALGVNPGDPLPRYGADAQGSGGGGGAGTRFGNLVIQ